MNNKMAQRHASHLPTVPELSFDQRSFFRLVAHDNVGIAIDCTLGKHYNSYNRSDICVRHVMGVHLRPIVGLPGFAQVSMELKSNYCEVCIHTYHIFCIILLH